MARPIQTIKRTAFAAALAALSAVTLPVTAVRAADDDCLSAPNSEASPGSHWYYRIDHANNGRKCWHLAAESETAHRGAAKPQAAAKTRALPAEAADDHTSSGQAEQSAPERALPSAGDEIGDRGTQGYGSPPVQSATAGDQPPTSSFAPWPDPPRPASATEPADASVGEPAAPEHSIAQVASSTAPEEDVAVPTPQSAAVEPAQPSFSLAWTLLQFVGALAAVGILLYGIFKFPVRRRRRARVEPRFDNGRLADKRSRPGFAAEGRSTVPRMAMEPIVPRSPPKKALRQILRELENAERRA